MPTDFIQESGSPIAVTSIHTELDLDPFDAPIDARIYIGYRNISQRPIEGVKFRMRFIDSNGSDMGTFQGPDGATVADGQERQQKWKRDRIDPHTTALKVRVLQVKFADGSEWDSEKLKELANPPSQTQTAGQQDPQSQGADNRP